MTTTTVEDAQKTLAQLETKLARATDALTSLQVERRQLSYDANVGDKAARKALDAANAASALAELEIGNVHAAIDEGQAAPCCSRTRRGYGGAAGECEAGRCDCAAHKARGAGESTFPSRPCGRRLKPSRLTSTRCTSWAS